MENRLYRRLPEPFAPASQRRIIAKLSECCVGADQVAHFVCGADPHPSVLQQALDASPDLAGLSLQRLAPDRWRQGLTELPVADVYLLDGILHYLSSTEINALIARLRKAAPRGARIVVLEPVCFPGNRPDDRDEVILKSIMDLVHAPARAIERDNIVVSPATRETQALLAKRWWGELPCGPAPLQRPFIGDELSRRMAQNFEIRSDEIVQVVIAHELGKELLLLADDEPQLARRLAAELLPALDELEPSLLGRQLLPDLSWYVSMLVAVVGLN